MSAPICIFQVECKFIMSNSTFLLVRKSSSIFHNYLSFFFFLLISSSFSFSPTTPPSVDRSTKPPGISHLTSIGSSSENAYGLRTVMVPKQLMDKFLKIAEPNTLANIETCGILAGKLVSRIHHVMLLAQISLTLSCHLSLLCISPSRSSRLQPVSAQICCRYLLAGHPTLACLFEGVHRSISLMSPPLLFQQCPACLVRLIWMVFVVGGRTAAVL